MGFSALSELGLPSKPPRLCIDINPTLAPDPESQQPVQMASICGDGSEFWTCPICFANLGSSLRIA